jgi:hypothetical protein
VTILDEITASFPLVVQGVEVNDPILTLFGEKWSLTIMCPWTLTGSGFATTWESENIEDDVWNLIGLSVVAVSADSSSVIDPIFVLDGDVKLSIHADTYDEPWFLTLPDVVVVGRRVG